MVLKLSQPVFITTWVSLASSEPAVLVQVSQVWWGVVRLRDWSPPDQWTVRTVCTFLFQTWTSPRNWLFVWFILCMCLPHSVLYCYLNMHPFIGFSTKSYRMNMCRHYSRILCSTFVLRLESLNFKKFVCLFVFVFVFVVAGKPRS